MSERFKRLLNALKYYLGMSTPKIHIINTRHAYKRSHQRTRLPLTHRTVRFIRDYVRENPKVIKFNFKTRAHVLKYRKLTMVLKKEVSHNIYGTKVDYVILTCGDDTYDFVKGYHKLKAKG